ncbi:hypothetical protein [Moorena sp. SIO3F7]|uniref:hypothetical protein n=1 Tax=Moorena sp. SIO3F7 TaxID=2607839 RepID=UPI001418BB96|nr:hypothetical protein [Moorena sp. SIO3F7]NEO14825.1 hypothetical protein [Moorena sp. SIO3E8]
MFFSSQVRCLGRRRKDWSLVNLAITATVNYTIQALHGYGVGLVPRSSSKLPSLTKP